MKMNKQATKKMHHSIGYTLFVKHDSEYGNEARSYTILLSIKSKL